MTSLIRKEIKTDGTFGGNYSYEIEYPMLPEKYINVTEEQRKYIDENQDKLRYDDSQDGIYETPKGIIDISDTSEYVAKIIEQTKLNMLSENALKRDERLLAGVEYKGILFDSDTDQKTNLMFFTNNMNDSDTVAWYGKNNTQLNCTKSDLLAIGELIANLTSQIWGIKNPSYVQQISESPDLETLNSIIIEY